MAKKNKADNIIGIKNSCLDNTVRPKNNPIK